MIAHNLHTYYNAKKKIHRPQQLLSQTNFCIINIILFVKPTLFQAPNYWIHLPPALSPMHYFQMSLLKHCLVLLSVSSPSKSGPSRHAILCWPFKTLWSGLNAPFPPCLPLHSWETFHCKLVYSQIPDCISPTGLPGIPTLLSGRALWGVLFCFWEF